MGSQNIVEHGSHLRDRKCQKLQSHGNKNLIVKISEPVCRGGKNLQNPKEKKDLIQTNVALRVFPKLFFWTKIIHGYVVFREKGERL